jgi:hypothetical protein
MPNRPRSHFIFVDLENVPDVDLSPLAEHSVHVTLLVGKKQSVLPDRLVRQITRLPFEVRLIKVGVSRKNALDMALAFHLGETAARHSSACFHVVSGDKRDFDPLMVHLEAHQIRGERAGAIETLSFLNASPRVATSPPEQLVPEITAPAPAAATPAKPTAALVAKVFAHFNNPHLKNRPRTRKSLLAHIANSLGKENSETNVNKVFERLLDAGTAFDAKGKVIYPETK